MTPEGLRAYPDVAAHHARMLADPGVRQAMLAEGLIEA